MTGIGRSHSSGPKSPWPRPHGAGHNARGFRAARCDCGTPPSVPLAAALPSNVGRRRSAVAAGSLSSLPRETTSASRIMLAARPAGRNQKIRNCWSGGPCGFPHATPYGSFAVLMAKIEYDDVSGNRAIVFCETAQQAEAHRILNSTKGLRCGYPEQVVGTSYVRWRVNCDGAIVTLLKNMGATPAPRQQYEDCLREIANLPELPADAAGIVTVALREVIEKPSNLVQNARKYLCQLQGQVNACRNPTTKAALPEIVARALATIEHGTA